MKDFKYKDIESVEKLFQCFTPSRIRKTLGYRESLEIARIALNKSFRRESDAVKALFNYFNSDDLPPEPPMCDCKPANGLRWQHSPVTWAYSGYQQDIPNTAHLIRANWKILQAVCSLQVQETNYANCNICITNGSLDGKGGTLGVAYQPASGQRMSACGEMCGNIIIDKDEVWTPEYLQTVLLHEMIHAVGISHAPIRGSVMYPSYLGVNLELDPWTIEQLQQRHPLTTPA